MFGQHAGGELRAQPHTIGTLFRVRMEPGISFLPLSPRGFPNSGSEARRESAWQSPSLSRAAIPPPSQLPQALIEQNNAVGLLLPRNGHRLKGYGIRRRAGCLAVHRSGAVPPDGVPMTSLPAAGT